MDNLSGSRCNHNGPYKKEAGVSDSEKMVSRGGHERLRGKGTETDSPLRASRRKWPCSHLDFGPLRLISASDLQNYERINLCCFKPLKW